MEREEGYYWIERTKEPLSIGGRSKWIAYYCGKYWQFIGSNDIKTGTLLDKDSIRVLDKVNE